MFLIQKISEKALSKKLSFFIYQSFAFLQSSFSKPLAMNTNLTFCLFCVFEKTKFSLFDIYDPLKFELFHHWLFNA